MKRKFRFGLLVTHRKADAKTPTTAEMRKCVCLLFLVTLFNFAFAQTQQYISTVTGITGQSICELQDSSMVFTGVKRYYDTVLLRNADDLILARMNRDGSGNFYTKYAAANKYFTEGDIKSCDDTTVLITAGISSSYWDQKLILLKANTAGVLKWCKYFDVTPSRKIDVNKATGSILVPYVISGENSAYLACLGTNGNIIWNKKFSIDTFRLNITRIKFLPDNGFLIVGAAGFSSSFLARFDATGLLLWCKRVRLPPSRLSIWAVDYVDNFIFCSGTFTDESGQTQSWHPYVMSFDMNGTYRFSKMYYSSDWSVCENFSMTALHDKTLVFNTEPEGGSVITNFWGGLIKIDTMGKVMSHNNFLVDKIIFPNEVIETKDHYIVSIGNMYNPDGATIIKLNTSFNKACRQFTPYIQVIDTAPNIFSEGILVNEPLTNSDVTLSAQRYRMIAEIICDHDTAEVSINDTLGLHDLDNDILSVNIFPNPASEKITIEISGWDFKEIDLTLFNMVGEALLKNQFNSFKKDLDISTLPKGIYIVELVSDKKRSRKKFVKWND